MEKIMKTTEYKGFVIEIILDDGLTYYTVTRNGCIIETGNPCIQDEQEAIEDAMIMIDDLLMDEANEEPEQHDDTPSLGDTFDHAKNQ